MYVLLVCQNSIDISKGCFMHVFQSGNITVT